MTAGDFKGQVNGYVDNEFGNSIATRADLSYSYKNAKERFTVNSKIRNESTKTITQFSMDGWVKDIKSKSVVNLVQFSSVNFIPKHFLQSFQKKSYYI